MILIVPFIGLLNSFFTNENFGLQKKINNFTYGTILAFCVLLVILYSFNGINYIRLFSFSRNVPIIFSSEPFIFVKGNGLSRKKQSFRKNKRFRCEIFKKLYKLNLFDYK